MMTLSEYLESLSDSERGIAEETVRLVLGSAKVGEIARSTSGQILICGNELWARTEQYVDCDLYAVPKELL